jgi:hypothetical protein
MLVEDTDIALIPVKQGEGWRALNVSKDELKIGEEIYGVSYREAGERSLRCNAIEIKDHSKTISNCGGTHGYSGTLYVMRSGDVKYVHAGGSHFTDLGDYNFVEEEKEMYIEFSGSKNEYENVGMRIGEAIINCRTTDNPAECNESIINLVSLTKQAIEM